jgi:hypothetical protein
MLKHSSSPGFWPDANCPIFGRMMSLARMNTFSLMRRVAIDKKPSGVSTKSSAGNTAKAGENWAPLEIACS